MPGRKSHKKAKPAHKARKKKPLSERESRLALTRQKILQFLELKGTKKIAVISDNDEDGMASAVQMKKFLDFSRVESEVFFYDHYSRSLSFPYQRFFDFNPEKTIFLDLNEGFISDVLLDIGKATGPFLVIDHHQGDIVRNNSFRCFVIKPRNFSSIEPSRYPVSKMVNDLFLGVDWVCAMGIIGDFAHDQWKDFLKKTEGKYHITRAKLKDLADSIACITSQYPEKMNSLFNFICSAKSPRDLLESEFFSLKKLFDARLKMLQGLFDERAEYYADVGVYFFKCDPRFSSKLSNIISVKNPDKLIAIYEEPGELVKCSLRRQDFRVNCGLLAKAAIEGAHSGNGGGHIPAAGATFPPHYLDEFKKRVRLYLLQNPPANVLK